MKHDVWMQRFEQYAEKMRHLYDVPGLAVAVADAGEMVYVRGFGRRDVERDLAVTPDTVFGIGSITKSFTCVAIMQLQEQGRLRLDDLVTRHLPDLRVPDERHAQSLTIHHLMTHTGGLPPLGTLFQAMAESLAEDPDARDDPGVPKPQRGLAPLRSYDDFVRRLSETGYTPLGLPGEQFSYSNDGYALLGAIVERASGLSYADYLRTHVLEPAALGRTGFELEAPGPRAEITELYTARPHGGGRGVHAAPGWWQAPSMASAGFLRSTVRDLLRYMEIYRTGGCVGGRRLLREESVRQMTSAYVACGPNRAYGYGLMVTPSYHGVSLVEHGGALKGISAHVLLVPEKGWTGALLSNLAGVPVHQILLGVVNARLGMAAQTRRAVFADYDCTPDQLQAYVGHYRSDEGANLRFFVERGEQLACESEGNWLSLRAVGPDAFLVSDREDETFARFLRDGGGRVVAVAYGLRIIRRSPA